MVNGNAVKHYVAEVAKTFGDATFTVETLGAFRYTLGAFRYGKRLRRLLTP